MEDLIKKLKANIEVSEEMGEDPDATGWGSQEGIIISVNEARDIIETWGQLKYFGY